MADRPELQGVPDAPPPRWRDPEWMLHTYCRRAKAALPEFAAAAAAGGCPDDPLVAGAPTHVCTVRVAAHSNEDDDERIEELVAQGEGGSAPEARASAASAAIDALERTALWRRRMTDLEPEESLWGTVALALSSVGLHKDLELRNFVLLSQQGGMHAAAHAAAAAAGGGAPGGGGGAAPDAASDAPRAVLPLTLLVHSRLVGRWFRAHEPGAGGDPHAMLGALLRRRGEEPQGSDEALLAAGLTVVDGGCSVQLLHTYFPPSGHYEVQSEVWDPLPVMVKVPADPRREVEELPLDPGAGDLLGQMARHLGTASPGRLVVWGRVGCKATWLAGSEAERAAAAAAGRLVGQRHNRRAREEPEATAATTTTTAAAPGGGAAAGPGGAGDEPPAKRAALSAAGPGGGPARGPPPPAPRERPPGAVGEAPAVVSSILTPDGRFPEGHPAGAGAVADAAALPRSEAERDSGARGAGGAGGVAASGAGPASGGGDLSVRSLLAEGHGPAAMDWAASTEGQEAVASPRLERAVSVEQRRPAPAPAPLPEPAPAVPAGRPPAAPQPPRARGGGGGRGRGSRGGGRGRRGGGRGWGARDAEAGANEIKLSEPTLYSLHLYSPNGAGERSGGAEEAFGAAAAELAAAGGWGGEGFGDGGDGDGGDGAEGGGGARRFNTRASWLAGRPVWGDALASLSRMTPTEVGHHLIRWRSYGRRDLELSLAALFPESSYARGRHLPVTARLPRAFRSMNSWLGPAPRTLLWTYVNHHASWRGRERWELREANGGAVAAPPAPLPAPAAEPIGGEASAGAAPAPAGAAEKGGGGAGAAGGAAAAPAPLWVARLTVAPFGREAPVVVESGGYLDPNDARQAAALLALRALRRIDAAALRGEVELAGPPPPFGGGAAAAPAAGGPEPMQAEAEAGAGAPPAPEAAAAAESEAAALESEAAAGDWEVEVLHPGPEGRAAVTGLVAKVDLTVALPRDAPPPPPFGRALPGATAAAAASEAAASDAAGGAGGFVVERTGLASMQGLSWELGTGAVVAPLEALVRALRPGGRGRVRARVTLEGPDPLGLFPLRPAFITATLLSLTTPKPPRCAPAVPPAEELEGGGPEPHGGAHPARGGGGWRGGGGGGRGRGGRGRGRGRGRGGWGGRGAPSFGVAGAPQLFEPPLREQAAALAEGLARALDAESVVILGGDGGETLGRLLRGRAFTRLRRVAVVDWIAPRLGRAAAALEAEAMRSPQLAFAGGGGEPDAGAGEGASRGDSGGGGGPSNSGGGGNSGGETAASAAAPQQRAAAQQGGGGGPGPAPAPAGPALSGLSAAGSTAGSVAGVEVIGTPQGGGGGGGGGKAAPTVASQAAAAAAAAVPGAPAPDAAAGAPAGEGEAAAATPPAAPWRVEVSLLEGDLNAPSLRAPEGWTASGLAGPDLAIVSEAAEQLGAPDEALEAVAGGVLRGLRPRALLLLTPNRDYNPVLRELAGDAALAGPAGPDGRQLRFPYDHFELSRPEFESWAAAAAGRGGAGYDLHAFGLGRARGDAATKAAAAAPPAAGSDAPAGAETGAETGEPILGASAAAALARDALAWGDASAEGAADAAPGGEAPLAGLGHAVHAALWLRRAEAEAAAPEPPQGAAGAGQGAASAAVGGAAAAALRPYCPPAVLEARLQQDRAEAAGAGAAVAVAPMEQF
ncbi:hypothetical protein Rsub_01533 [Raphidocelis subcapitata]|uniref:Small RNA 2'-O-methyltransferase n=1 Tax=Raphidocelis subcapitata TaxID=307507 RepID=A0A2V0NNB3_9CHLO|nr:hypothetical protein Rsub_01533 [Raphidocelis subcapitata]|eukprot:GBF89034.1 hypothetical protein Rsub_01533 [Raphidocelis subcapitata]